MREIDKLKKMLDDASIPYESNEFTYGAMMEPDQICYPKASLIARRCSIIFGRGTYGYEDGLLEIMGLLTPEEEEYDSVVGYLSAEEVFERINEDWAEYKED